MHLQLGAACSPQPSPVQINTVDNKGMSIVTELLDCLLSPLFLLILSYALSPFSLCLVLPRGVGEYLELGGCYQDLGEERAA